MSYVGRIPTHKWNAKAGPALQLAGVKLDKPDAYDVGVEVDAPDLATAYAAITNALRDAGVELSADAFTIALYATGPGEIVVGPDAA